MRFRLVCKVIFSCALAGTAQVAFLDNARNNASDTCQIITVGKSESLMRTHPKTTPYEGISYF